VNDGDTLRTTSGARIRLVQIDAPELHPDCSGKAALAALRRLAPAGTAVTLMRFFHGDVGRYARDLLTAVTEAPAARRGYWGACPDARLDPGRGSITGPG
jgi:endonuclease YncB( thermonuclease family)